MAKPPDLAGTAATRRLRDLNDDKLLLIMQIGDGVCWEPSWYENIELRAKKAIE
jgi:hypothetical protein